MRRTASSARVSRLSVSYDYGKALRAKFNPTRGRSNGFDNSALKTQLSFVNLLQPEMYIYI